MYNEESNLCLVGPNHGILSAFSFNFARRKSAFLFKLLLLCSAICLNTPYKISTCSFLKSWSVELKSDGLIFSFAFEKLSINEIKQSTGERLTLLWCKVLFSICYRRNIIKERWKILFLSSLIHNLAVMFSERSRNACVRYFLFSNKDFSLSNP